MVLVLCNTCQTDLRGRPIDILGGGGAVMEMKYNFPILKDFFLRFLSDVTTNGIMDLI